MSTIQNNILTDIYNTTTNGGITFTGNTLGLSKAPGTQDAGTANAIGAFISTNPLFNVPSYPASSDMCGTTLNMALNSSSAVLTLPPNITVLHAELFWGGTYLVDNENYLSMAKNPVEFTIPTTPVEIYTINFDNFYQINKTPTVGVYSCHANVTSLVQKQNGLSGTYSVTSVVGTVTPSNDSDNCCGWTLAVVYESSQNLPYRYLNLRGGLALINPNNTVNESISQFQTPTSGTTNARIQLSALSGDATIGGDQVFLGSNANSLHALSGPKNATNNFFASQINNDLGETDTQGTFGNMNQNIDTTTSTGTNIPGGRQGYDITNIDASNILANSQTSGIISFQTSSNVYLVNALGTQVDIHCPNFVDLAMEANPTSPIDNGTLVNYTIKFTNSGSNASSNTLLKSSLPLGFEFVANSLEIDGTPSADSIITGINLGTIQPGKASIITFTLKAVNLPTPGNRVYTTSTTLTFDFPSYSGTIINGIAISDPCSVYHAAYTPRIQLSLSDNKTIVAVGDTIDYTLTIINPSNHIYYDPTMYFPRFTLPEGLVLNENSVKYNNTPVPNASSTSKISLPNFDPNSSNTLTFSLNIVSTPSEVFDYNVQCNISYYIRIPGYNGNAIYDSNSCTAISPRYFLKPTLSIQSNKIYVTPKKDTIEYTITISNTHTMTISGITLIDILPSGLSYKPNSLTVDSVPSNYSIKSGVFLGNLQQGKSVTVQFVANVDSEPDTGRSYPNFATINYILASGLGPIPQTVNTKTVSSYLPGTNPLFIKNFIYITNKNIPINGNLYVVNLNESSPNCTINHYPINGYAEVSNNGQWKYTPKIGFVGKDTFSISYNNMKSTLSTVTIIVKDYYSLLDSGFCRNP